MRSAVLEAYDEIIAKKNYKNLTTFFNEENRKQNKVLVGVKYKTLAKYYRKRVEEGNGYIHRPKGKQRTLTECEERLVYTRCMNVLNDFSHLANVTIQREAIYVAGKHIVV